MPVGEEDEATVVGVDLDAGGDAEWLLAVVLRAALDEFDLLHQRVDERVFDLGLRLVLRGEDGRLPDVVDVLGALDELFLCECVLDQ